MQGYQLSFFTEQNRTHHGLPLAEWLLQSARKQGIRGATLIAASEGFGQHGKLHSARFFELADQPVEITMAVTGEESCKLLDLLRAEQINLFCVRTPIEFGMSADF